MRVVALTFIGFMSISSDLLASNVACRDNISSGGGSYGPPFKVTHSFSNNSVANADEVNQNFTDIVEGINSRLMVDLDFPQNVAVGFNALSSVNDSIFPGTENTAIGYLALSKTIEGYHNTAMGYEALCNNLGGIKNTAVGSFALHQANSLYNTAVGWGALRNTTGGESNTALGYAALESNTTGIFNSAGSYLALRENVTGNSNTATGSAALYGNVSGDGNTAVGSSALQSNEAGDNNAAFGSFADVTSGNLSNATAIGYNAKVDASNKVRIGNTDVTVIQGQVAFTSSSDARLKDSIAPVNDGLALINDLKPVSYHRKNNPESDIEMGLLAQEVEAALEKHGLGNSGMVHQPTEEAYMSLRYNDLMAPMIRAIQELDDASEAKDAQIASLQEQLQFQREELLALVQLQQQQIAQLQKMVEHQFAVN